MASPYCPADPAGILPYLDLGTDSLFVTYFACSIDAITDRGCCNPMHTAFFPSKPFILGRRRMGKFFLVYARKPCVNANILDTCCSTPPFFIVKLARSDLSRI